VEEVDTISGFSKNHMRLVLGSFIRPMSLCNRELCTAKG